MKDLRFSNEEDDVLLHLDKRPEMKIVVFMVTSKAGIWATRVHKKKLNFVKIKIFRTECGSNSKTTLSQPSSTWSCFRIFFFK